MTNALEIAAPGETFNFAQHLLEVNERRAAKTVYVDDHGALTYGELADRVRRLGAALRAIGVKREERVLLLMHDCNDWPVSFLGALHAGVVPVAINTMLTADDYAYVLANCRAQAAIVSAALLPVLVDALARTDHEVGCIVVSRPSGSTGCCRLRRRGWPSASPTCGRRPRRRGRRQME